MARKARFENYPGVIQLSNGKYIFRHKLIGQRVLPAVLGSEEFAAEYERCRQLVSGPKAEAPAKLPTFQDAMIEFQKSAEWGKFEETETIRSYSRYSKSFLGAPITEGNRNTFSVFPIGAPESELLPLLRDHVATYGPHQGKRVRILIGKLFEVAIAKKWALRNLANDIARPKVPKSKGAKRWPIEIIEQYLNRHKPGSPAHTAFMLARYVGSRRGDVCTIGWDSLRPHRYIDDSDQIRVVTVVEFWTEKNKKREANSFVTVIVRPELEAALNALDRSKGGTILKNNLGGSYSVKSMTGQMRFWCKQADIPKGYSLHGLRRSFASEIAEGTNGDVLALQKALGHRDLTTTQIYLNELDAEPMAIRAAEAAERRAAQVKRLRTVEK